MIASDHLNAINKRIERSTETPIAVGGVGGSGTRLVAHLLKEIGVYLGSDLNAACDNLWFSFLFRREEILTATSSQFEELLDIFVTRVLRTGALTHKQKILIQELALTLEPTFGPDSDWVKRRAASLLHAEHECPATDYWGWKEPNTHMVLDRLDSLMPRMRYIHVVRNGLDMAFSANQNQLVRWGRELLKESFEVNPYYSLKFWRRVHERMLATSQSMESRFLFVNFDRLCTRPKESIAKIVGFAEIRVPDADLDKLTSLVRPPRSIGRHQQYPLNIFDPDDVEFAMTTPFGSGDD